MEDFRSDADSRTLEEGLDVLARVIAVAHIKKHNRNHIGVQSNSEDIEDGEQYEESEPTKNIDGDKQCEQ